MAETLNQNRRRVLAATAATLAAAQLIKAVAADAPTGSTKSSFGPLKQIDAGVLNVAYAETGPADPGR